MPRIYKKIGPMREALSAQMRCFLIQAMHGDVDRELGMSIWATLEKLHPVAELADWISDLSGTGYKFDPDMTKIAHKHLGPVYRVVMSCREGCTPFINDGAGVWRWLHDTRTVEDFKAMGEGNYRAGAYIFAMRDKNPDLHNSLWEEIKVPYRRESIFPTPEEVEKELKGLTSAAERAAATPAT